MQNHKHILLITLLLHYLTRKAIPSITCPKCGKIPVPYPLSTSETCGDQLYKVRCTAGTLWFDTLNKSSYIITSIAPNTQRLVLRPQGFYKTRCTNIDLQSGGIWLNQTLPFTITDSITVLKFNCTDSTVNLSSMDCTKTSPCYSYMNRSIELNARCKGLNCCSYTTGGSKTAYRIDVSQSGCTSFESFVGLNHLSSPVRGWPKAGIQIQWEKPREPRCVFPLDCKGLVNATCLPDPAMKGYKRCFCNKGFVWDPINGMCDSLTFSISAMVIVIIFFALVHQHKQHIKREAHRKLVKQREDILNANNHGKSAKLFSGKEIKKATNNFSKENLIGIGGFGEVYKGNLDDGTLAAIKKAKNGNALGMDQVLNEVCILCQVNHRSLVRLLGCCLDLDQPVLVYEYVSNGTLFEHLHGRFSNEYGTLTWHRRLLIAKQTAQGLSYLHFSAVPPIFHRDIKSSNILLDENLNAKVSDFGLSRLIDPEATHISTCAQGTLGYLDPDYYQNYQLTDKSDVYSFGVVLLELLTSMKAIDFNREDDVNLAIYASKLSNQDRLLDVVDLGLKTQANELELETMTAFGLLAVACVEEQRKNRPSMRQVTEELEYIISIIAKNGKLSSLP
ncbi:wall-associated receptor kinase-like 20 [Amaranthus tricolor]|uniref:wall-associated receptor kinase-like 20 n=1 Tax=Amaranthus tricolor TaxID=29722 RepID=UPI00258F1A17|nr:wall-associated receptor kinase-like 20 [Amaranthus tricolor]